MAKNRHFGQKLTFLWKIEIFMKNRIFYEKSKFLWKIEIFMKNWNFYEKSKFLWKIEILAKNRHFGQKLTFWWTIAKNRHFSEKKIWLKKKQISRNKYNFLNNFFVKSSKFWSSKTCKSQFLTIKTARSNCTIIICNSVQIKKAQTVK